jgi:hypothetical protein
VLVTTFYTVCMGSSASLVFCSFPMELFRQPRVSFVEDNERCTYACAHSVTVLMAVACVRWCWWPVNILIYVPYKCYRVFKDPCTLLAQTMQCRLVEWLDDWWIGKYMDGSGRGWFEVLPQIAPKWTDGNLEDSPSGQPIFWPISEPWTAWLRSCLLPTGVRLS